MMHGKVRNKIHKVGERLTVVETQSTVGLKLGSEYIDLTEIEVAVLRNILSMWKNDKRWREQRKNIHGEDVNTNINQP